MKKNLTQDTNFSKFRMRKIQFISLKNKKNLIFFIFISLHNKFFFHFLEKNYWMNLSCWITICFKICCTVITNSGSNIAWKNFEKFFTWWNYSGLLKNCNYFFIQFKSMLYFWQFLQHHNYSNDSHNQSPEKKLFLFRTLLLSAVKINKLWLQQKLLLKSYYQAVHSKRP